MQIFGKIKQIVTILLLGVSKCFGFTEKQTFYLTDSKSSVEQYNAIFEKVQSKQDFKYGDPIRITVTYEKDSSFDLTDFDSITSNVKISDGVEQPNRTGPRK